MTYIGNYSLDNRYWLFVMNDFDKAGGLEDIKYTTSTESDAIRFFEGNLTKHELSHIKYGYIFDTQTKTKIREWRC